MSNDSAKTSNADKLIEAVQEVRKSEKPVQRNACPECGSNRYESRRPLGGPLICTCRDCGHQYNRGRPNLAPLIAAKAPGPQGSGKGPVYTNKKPRRGSKHTPTYRAKGKKR